MKIILLALLLFTSTPSFSQGINGKYKNVYGEEIVIFDGMFYLIAKKTERCIAIWQPDTLAICEVKQINKSVLECSGIQKDLHRTWTIERTYEKREDDSIKIIFTIPYQMNDLNIIVGTYPGFKDFKNHNHEKFVMIPKCEQFDFEISPTVWFGEHFPVITHGRIHFYSSELSIDNIEIGEGNNRIDVKIPKLDDYFFARYHVYKDYIYINGRELHWNGVVYKKQE